MLDIGSPFAGMRVRWLACYRLVPRLCCSAASLAVNMLIRCSKFSEQISCSLNNSWDDFGTLIWPHFGRLIWPHLIYSDRSSYPVPASRDGEGDGQETQGGTV